MINAFLSFLSSASKRKIEGWEERQIWFFPPPPPLFYPSSSLSMLHLTSDFFSPDFSTSILWGFIHRLVRFILSPPEITTLAPPPTFHRLIRATAFSFGSVMGRRSGFFEARFVPPAALLPHHCLRHHLLPPLPLSLILPAITALCVSVISASGAADFWTLRFYYAFI